ncbi:hypothetical protein OG21DRAFT_420603 [Imleria badia]|nr:hypothetical protein OG21DRAFT_420603 [Imleria badia]
MDCIDKAATGRRTSGWVHIQRVRSIQRQAKASAASRPKHIQRVGFEVLSLLGPMIDLLERLHSPESHGSSQKPQPRTIEPSSVYSSCVDQTVQSLTVLRRTQVDMEKGTTKITETYRSTTYTVIPVHTRGDNCDYDLRCGVDGTNLIRDSNFLESAMRSCDRTGTRKSGARQM